MSASNNKFLSYTNPQLNEVRLPVMLSIPDEVRLAVEAEINTSFIDNILADIYKEELRRGIMMYSIPGYKKVMEILEIKDDIKYKYKKKGKRYIRKVVKDGLVVIGREKYEKCSEEI